MTLGSDNWLASRGRGIHITIRDVDCRDFDVDDMIRVFNDCRVTFFSFFCGGYVTTYPTGLEFQRVSPWLDGRDLTGEIIEKAHAAGMRAVPMIDLAMLPEHAYKAHPEWAAVDATGSPVMQTDGLYASCPMGGYVQEYSREMVAEIVSRYDVDAMRFGGGSYGFGRNACHCDSCRSAYRGDTGADLPAARDWSSPEWRRYIRWRVHKTTTVVRRLADIVHAQRPGLPMLGNAVCFGDPHWTINSSLDIERLAGIQDAVQVEIQSRAWNAQPDGEAYWQYLRWPAETASLMTSICDKPIWAVTSYFYAWPWRRVSAPAVEQKVYLAQAIAHGASPMVNLSGGPPAVHEDCRGFDAIRDLYAFAEDSEAHIDGDQSCAEIALVFDQDTLMYYGNDQADQRYVDELRGFEDALHRAHIPFDIISSRTLASDRLSRYRCIVLPNAACLPEASAAAVKEFTAAGGGVVGSFETGLYDEDVARLPAGRLDELFGISGNGAPCSAVGDGPGPLQAYLRRSHTHTVGAELESIELLPLSGTFRPVEATDDVAVIYRRTQPFRVFPEGWSYPQGEDPAEPLVIAREGEGGRTVYFACQAGRSFMQSRYPDLAALICSAVLWAHGGTQPATVQGPPTVHTSVRRTGASRTVHCINLTSGERFFTELVPVHDITITLRAADPRKVTAARSLRTGSTLPVENLDGCVTVVLPRLEDYDIVLLESDTEDAWNR